MGLLWEDLQGGNSSGEAAGAATRREVDTTSPAINPMAMSPGFPQVVGSHECKELLNRNSSLVKINVELELCAGKKNFIPKYPVYTKIVRGNEVVRRLPAY